MVGNLFRAIGVQIYEKKQKLSLLFVKNSFRIM